MDSAPEPQAPRRAYMPIWALTLCVAIAATCIGVIAMVLIFRNEANYKRDVYNNCVAASSSLAKITGAFVKARNADAEILQRAKTVPPATRYGLIDLHAVQQKVEADDELLSQLKTPDCSRLK